jgi:pyridoxine kinase
MSTKRVLSIQSHVVSGYVGNKAAVFPLQLLGFEVDIINSVHFSNHTGYPNKWEGDVLDGTKLLKLIDGLDRNGLLDCGLIDHMLTGYIGSESFLCSVVTIVKKLRSLNPKTFRFVCDPVLGDAGKLYVPSELVDIYRKEVLPLSDVATPNQFEAEVLTGVSIKTIGDAQNACEILHDMGVPLILITSIILATHDTSHTVGMLASRRRKSKSGPEIVEQYVLHAPLIAGQFTGTGDVCAALFLAWTADLSDGDSNELNVALEKVGGTMHAIVKRTAEYAEKIVSSSSSNEDEAKRVFSREMQLIKSRDDIITPPRLFNAIKLAPSTG